MKKKISIATSCFNEAGNIQSFYDRCLAVLRQFPEYDYEFVVSDNGSTDGTRAILRDIASKDPCFKVIFNTGNFGQLRSPYNAIRSTAGDAVAVLCSDLQEPPEVIADFIRKWQEGAPIVAGVRCGSENAVFSNFLRGLYYRVLARIAPDQHIIRDFTGFGLYDRKVICALDEFNDACPYFRGMISETGFPVSAVPFRQQERKAGKTKNNLFTLYDCAMTGLVNHTRLPLRFAVFCGFALGFISFLVSLGYLLMKLIYWHSFSFGMAPLMIGLFFFASIQLIFIGILGEYIGAIWTQVRRRPLVVEEERINFDSPRN